MSSNRLSPSPATPARESQDVCSICEKQSECRPIGKLRPAVLKELEGKGLEPGAPNATVCTACLSTAMTQHARSMVQQKPSELSQVEQEITERATEIVEEIEHGIPSTFGHRAADAVARIGGSWGFVLGFIAMLLLWAVVNSVVLAGGFDPYPYILLNLVLSCIASIQAPIILMSQSRMAQIDRIRATEDFRINLKAELEIAALHEKIDHLVSQQWERMLEMQKVQLEILEELRDEPGGEGAAPRGSAGNGSNGSPRSSQLGKAPSATRQAVDERGR
jgi:uncharacterized membrane protein